MKGIITQTFHLLKKNRLLKKTPGFLLITASVVFFIISGYFITYQLFFTGTGIDELDTKKADKQCRVFRYNNVRYFKGICLNRENSQNAFTTERFEIYPPAILDNKKTELELFIRLETDGRFKKDPAKEAGRLLITETTGENTVTNEIALYGTLLQRHSIPVTTQSRVKNSITIRFMPANPNISGVLIGTAIHTHFFREIILWGSLALLTLLLWILLNKKMKSTRLYLIILTVLVLAYFRSGAFISNEFFLKTTGQAATAKTSFGHAMHYFKKGAWKDTMYKPVGTKIIPFLVLLAEPEAVKNPGSTYITTYPTPRYIWFLFECLGLCFLVSCIYRYLSRTAGVLFPLVYVCFFPFLIDIYNMEGDAYSIIYMMILTGLLLKWTCRKKLEAADYISLFVATFLMLVTKISSAFLVVFVPAGFALGKLPECARTPSKIKPLFLLFCMILALFSASAVKKSVNTPREAQPGIKYYRSNIWSMLWAAQGISRKANAFPFTVSGRTRDKIIGKAAGLPPEKWKRLRHTRLGNELIFKPQLVQAIKETPGLFYANAIYRFIQYGPVFSWYKKMDYWKKRKNIQKSIAMDTFWKIAPLVVVNNLFDFPPDTPLARFINLLLIAAALCGILFIRKIELIVIFFGSFFVKLSFNTFVHGMVRYFNFTHVPLLIGLTIFIIFFYKALYQIGKDYFINASDNIT